MTSGTGVKVRSANLPASAQTVTRPVAEVSVVAAPVHRACLVRTVLRAASAGILVGFDATHALHTGG